MHCRFKFTAGRNQAAVRRGGSWPRPAPEQSSAPDAARWPGRAALRRVPSQSAQVRRPPPGRRQQKGRHPLRRQSAQRADTHSRVRRREKAAANFRICLTATAAHRCCRCNINPFFSFIIIHTSLKNKIIFFSIFSSLQTKHCFRHYRYRISSPLP